MKHEWLCWADSQEDSIPEVLCFYRGCWEEAWRMGGGNAINTEAIMEMFVMADANLVLWWYVIVLYLDENCYTGSCPFKSSKKRSTYIHASRPPPWRAKCTVLFYFIHHHYNLSAVQQCEQFQFSHATGSRRSWEIQPAESKQMSNIHRKNIKHILTEKSTYYCSL